MSMGRIHNRGRDGTRKSEYREKVAQLEKQIRQLKRKLKNCVCPHCGFGFEQAQKGE